MSFPVAFPNVARLVALLFATTSLLQESRAQAPWAVMPGAPYFLPYMGPGSSTRSVGGATSPASNVLWVATSTYEFRSSNSDLSRTTDNGQTWQTYGVSRGTTIGLSANGNELVDYCVLDASTAWVLTRNAGAGSNRPYNAVIARTTTGPAGLVTIPGVLPAEFAIIHFFSSTTGVALARPASGSTNWGIYRTTNSGTTWSALAGSIPVAQTGDYLGAKATNGNSLWISTTTGNVVYTSDGGLTWASSTTGLGYMRNLVFRDPNNGLAYDIEYQNRRQLARTVDGGRTWSLVATPWPADVTTIVAQPVAGPGTANTYIGAGVNRLTYPNYAGVVATSSDDGATWQTRLTDNVAHRYLATSATGQLWTATSEGPSMLLRYTGTPLAARVMAEKGKLAYPNPTTGLLNLAAKKGETVRVYNSTGQLRHCPATAGQLDLSAFPAGIYLVVVTAQTGGAYTQRVAVVR